MKYLKENYVPILCTLLVCIGIWLIDIGVYTELSENVAYITDIREYKVKNGRHPIWFTQHAIHVEFADGTAGEIHSETLYQYCTNHVGDEINITCQVTKFGGKIIHRLTTYYVEPEWAPGNHIQIQGIY